MKLAGILIAITLLFFVFLLFKTLFVRLKNLCALCGAVSLTWMGLLLGFKLNLLMDPATGIIIALLMGQSVLGVFYLIQEKSKRGIRDITEKEDTHKTNIRILSLPIHLTLTTIALVLLAVPEDIKTVLIFLLAIWLIFGSLLVYRTNPYVHRVTKKIIECCKRW